MKLNYQDRGDGRLVAELENGYYIAIQPNGDNYAISLARKGIVMKSGVAGGLPGAKEVGRMLVNGAHDMQPVIPQFN